LKVEIRGQGALLKSEISDALKVLINLSEHSLHLPDTLNPHLVDVEELNLLLNREVLEALNKLRHRLLIDDHILIGFTSEHDRLHILIIIYLVADVSVAEVSEL